MRHIEAERVPQETARGETRDRESGGGSHVGIQRTVREKTRARLVTGREAVTSR
jgi:hypothetical protein